MRILFVFVTLISVAFSQEIASIDTLYGAERFTNGTFDSDISGWAQQGTPSTFEWVASGGGFTGALHIITNTFNQGGRQNNLSLTSGATYRLMMSYNTISADRQIRIQLRNGATTYTTDTGNGQTGAFVVDTVVTGAATSSSAYLWFFSVSPSTGHEYYLDNVSLREITGYDTTYVTGGPAQQFDTFDNWGGFPPTN